MYLGPLKGYGSNFLKVDHWFEWVEWGGFGYVLECWFVIGYSAILHNFMLNLNIFSYIMTYLECYYRSGRKR